jgi:hypothetical protein
MIAVLADTKYPAFQIKADTPLFLQELIAKALFVVLIASLPRRPLLTIFSYLFVLNSNVEGQMP